MRIDLHCHSTYSDGTETPSNLLQQAHQANIDVLALTDHDTIEGLAEAKAMAEKLNIQLINGVEISCHHQLTGGYGKNQSLDKIIHVVGLNFQNTQMMNDALNQLQDSRANRGKKIVERLAEILSKDFNHLWQAVLVKANQQPKAVGRAHIAQVLYDMGVVNTVQQAFDKYLADNKPAYVAIDALSMEDGIDLIQQCGGQAVLAHPTRYKLSASRIRRLIAEFAELKGDGCELPAGSEPLSTRQMVDRHIEHYRLKVSVGSDYHGSIMPWRKLGDVPKLHKGQVGVWEGF